ncbi:MAG TPA: hypothetical protein VIX81_10745, partial [Gammaproteobacteria bacterium]
MNPKLRALTLSALLATGAGVALAATAEAPAPAPTTPPAVQAPAAGAQAGAAKENNFVLAKQYYGECKGVSPEDFDKIVSYMKAFTDMEEMADTVADPARFFQLVNVVNDPRTIHVMMKCGMEPVMWDTWVHGLSDYEKMARVMGRFMNPNVYMAWMMAPMNQQVWQPVTAMADPNRYLVTWPQGMMNPQFYQPFLAPMDPNWYTP